MNSTEEKSGRTGGGEGETTGISKQNKKVCFKKKKFETFFLNQIIFEMH